MHGSFGEKSIDPNTEELDNVVLIACTENQNSSDADSSVLTKRPSISSSDQNTTKETIADNQCTSRRTTDDNPKLQETSKEGNVDVINQGSAINHDDNRHLVHITKDVSTFSGFIRDLIDKKSEKNDGPVEITRRKSSISVESVIINDPRANDQFEDAMDVSITSSETGSQDIERDKPVKCPKLDARGGKYNKKVAPLPPSKSDQSSPIKATLVLQPGVVKNCLPEDNKDCKEFFVHSPKAKRRSSAKRSHSFFSSSSSSSSKSNKSLSKLIKFPKMIGFWNRDEASCEKKPSWQSFVQQGFLKPSLSDSKLQSKSDTNISVSDQVINVSLHGTNLPKSGSLMSVRSLTESPLAYRRLKIIRRYVDDDID